MFNRFILAESKKLLLSIQTYLLDNINDERDPNVEIIDAGTLELTTNVGLKLHIRVRQHCDILERTAVDFKRDQKWSNSSKNTITDAVHYANSCIKALSNYDVIEGSKTAEIDDYYLADDKNLQGYVRDVVAHDQEVADYFFKRFPLIVTNILIRNNVYDREKILSTHKAKSMADVVNVYANMTTTGYDLLTKLINLIISHCLKADDETDIKGIDVSILKDKLDKTTFNKLKLAIDKANRSDEEREFDSEHDRFIFVGHEKFEPVPGTEHHQKTLEIERLIKADRFDLQSHGNLNMMKMRARIHGADTYLVSLPKNGISDEDIENPPSWLVKLIDKHKVKI